MENKKFNYFSIPHLVLEEEKFKNLPLAAKLVFVYFFKYRNRYQKDGFFRRVEDICEDTGLCKLTVIRAKKELVEKKLLIINKNRNQSFKHKRRDTFFLDFLFESCSEENKPC